MEKYLYIWRKKCRVKGKVLGKKNCLRELVRGKCNRNYLQSGLKAINLHLPIRVSRPLSPSSPLPHSSTLRSLEVGTGGKKGV